MDRARKLPQAARNQITLFALTTLAAYVYVASEWLFFVTKPSTLSALSLGERATVLVTSPLFIAAAALPLAGAAALIDTAIRRFGPRGWRFECTLLVPAAIATATEVLLLENFTYTIFGFSVGSTSGPLRLLYALIFTLMFVATYRWFRRSSRTDAWRWNSRRVIRLSLVLLVLLVISVATALGTARNPAAPVDEAFDTRSPAPTHRFNILILAADGVNAASMSAYGAERQTTPFIDGLVSESLVSENHFTNSAKTTGAIGALLSGKLPTRTRLVYRPDVFRGEDVYEHFPGVLRGLGYTNGDFSVRHFADAYDLNMRDGFHYANHRSFSDDGPAFLMPPSWQAAHPAESLFLEESFERITSRVLHAFAIQDMTNPWAEVTQLAGPTDLGTDQDRVDELLAFIERTPEPWFAHAHLLGTHGQFFNPQEPVWSKGKPQNRGWLPDFYDDAIADFDRVVERVVSALRETGQLEHTILVINSDHGMRWNTAARLPLIIRFPTGVPNGRITESSQRIDIAPTLLAAVDASTPDWMEGRSLLGDDLGRMRPIIISHNQAETFVDGWMQVPNPSPPFHTLGGVSVIICQRHYHMDTRKSTLGRVSTRTITGHTQPCPEEALPDETEMKAFIVDHLDDAGYDVSSLRGTMR